MKCGEVSLTCWHCGAEAPLDDFCRTPVGGDLPRGQFQCPKCGNAAQRREVERGETIKGRNGATMYIPGRLALVPCEARL